MRKIILAFHNLIVLIWLIIVVGIFKITTNLQFSNGNSLIFLALIIIFPSFIYIYTAVNKKKIRKLKKTQQATYYNQIKESIKKEQFKEELLDKILELGLEYKLVEAQDTTSVTIYTLDYTMFNLTFTYDYAMLQLCNTEITYYFYYSNHMSEYSKYDLRNFQYKEIKILYLKIIERITSLIQNVYVYTQSNKLLRLTMQDTNEIIYELHLNKKLFSNLKKKKQIINLKYEKGPAK